MKRLMIIAAYVNAAFCADVTTQPQTIEIKFIDPEAEQKSATGTYPIGIIKEIPYLEMQQHFVTESKKEEAALELPIDKEIFDKLMTLNPAEPLSEDLDFSSCAQLIHAINLLQLQKFETPAFKAHIAKRIAADLNENSDQYSKMILDILKYKPLLDEYFKNGEFSEAITSFINTKLFSGSLLSLFVFQEKTAHDLSTYNSLCLSFDGNHIFQGTASKTETTLNKRDLVTGDIVASSSIPTQFEDPIEYLAATNQFVAAQLKTGRTIILDQASLQMKYEFSLKYVKEGKNGYVTLIPGSEQKGFPENYFVFVQKSPFWGKFSFSPDGTYLLAYNQMAGIYREKDVSFDYSVSFSSNPVHLIDMKTGAHRFFWVTPNKSLAIYEVEGPLFSNDSKQIYYFALDNEETNERKLWITQSDSLAQESFAMPLSPFENPKWRSKCKLLYQVGNFLWIRMLNDPINECYTFDTIKKIFDNKGSSKYFQSLYLSDAEIAIAANNDNTKNFQWTLRSPMPKDMYRNSIYLNNPQNIVSLKDPTQGQLLKQIQGADFSFETLSFDKRTFVVENQKSKKGTARYVFQKARPLPFDILFGILCFQKNDKLDILGPIRTALRPSIDTLPQEVKPIIQKYFFEKMKQVIPRAKEEPQ